MTAQAATSAGPAIKGPLCRLSTCCGLLTAAVLVCLMGVGTWRYQELGMPGVWGATLAAAICHAGALAALILTVKLRGQRAVAGLLLAMACRGALPFGVAVVVMQSGGVLAEMGVAGSILAIYLVTLLVETSLAWQLLKTLDGQDSATRDSRTVA